MDTIDIFILQVKKLRNREDKIFSQGQLIDLSDRVLPEKQIERQT